MKLTEEAKCMISTCAAFSSTWITVCLGVRALSFWVALGSPNIHILSWRFLCLGRNLKMGCCHHLWKGVGHVQEKCLWNSELCGTSPSWAHFLQLVTLTWEGTEFQSLSNTWVTQGSEQLKSAAFLGGEGNAVMKSRCIVSKTFW